MPESLFGTDGIRGRVGTEPITPQTIMKLGWAVGRVFVSDGSGDKVLIGKDTRVSGYLLESSLEAGFSAAGMDVCFLGPLPTPAIAHLTRTVRGSAGVVISASHNPYHDNGIKIFSAEGTKLSDALALRIEQMMRQPMSCVDSKLLGKAERLNDAQGRYIEFCKSSLPAQRHLNGIKVVVDCANGAAYEVAPRVFAELGAEVIAMGNTPDGFNINHQCGSTHLATLQAKVRAENADLGVALDGDADRVLLVDADGDPVDGDQILYLLAKRRENIKGVVGTVMSNHGLELALKKIQVPLLRVPVGDRHVYEALVKKRWHLGGEPSGHIICLDKSTTGDGILAALGVLDAMLQQQRPLRQLVEEVEIYPQVMINIPLAQQKAKHLVNRAEVQSAVAQTQRELGKTGRVVLRPSGTEPLLRVMVESETVRQSQQLAEQIAAAVAHAEKSAQSAYG